MHTLELFSDPYCPCRERVVSFIQDISNSFQNLKFRDMNALEHPSRLEKLGIKMFPFLLLDGEIIKIGIPDEKELQNMLKYRLVPEVCKDNKYGG